MARYANTGEYNFKYPLRRRVANTLKKVIKDEALIDTGTLYDSVRINAKVSTEGNLRIQILAAYYFGYLNNGTATIAVEIAPDTSPADFRLTIRHEESLVLAAQLFIC